MKNKMNLNFKFWAVPGSGSRSWSVLKKCK